MDFQLAFRDASEKLDDAFGVKRVERDRRHKAR